MGKFFLTKRRAWFVALLLFCSVIIALIYITPHLAGFYKLKKQGLDYYPMSLEAGPATDFYDEISNYLPYVREVWEGHWPAANTDVYELMNGPAARHALSSLVLFPFFYLGRTVTGFVVVSDFVFSAISFLLLFVLAFMLTRQRFLSLFFAFVISLSPKIALYIFPLHLSSFKDLIKHFIPLRIDMWLPDNSDLVKMYAMKPGLPFLLLFLLFLYLTLKKQKAVYPILTGIFLGSLFYIYSFHWVFSVIVMGLLSVLLILSKDYLVFKRIFLAGAVAVLVSLPFWYYNLWFSFLPNYQEYKKVVGAEISHAFRWSMWPEYLLYIFLTFTIWFFYKKDNRPLVLYLSSLLLSSVAVYNIQVITGYQFQPGHWSIKIIWLVLALTWLAVGAKLFKIIQGKRQLNIAKISLLVIVALFTFNAFVGKFIWASGKYNYWTIPDNQIQSFKWLEKNSPLDSVVMTPSLVTNRYLINYTSNKIYLPFYENAPSNEILDRLYITYKIFNVSDNYFDEVFFLGKHGMVGSESGWSSINFHEKRGIMYVYGFRFTDRSLDSNFKKSKSTITSEITNKIVENYRNYPEYRLNFLLNKYRIDYIYYGPSEKKIVPDANLESKSFLEKVYGKGEVEIYKVNLDKISKL